MEAALSVQALSKVYKLYDKPSDRLIESIFGPLIKKRRHKEVYALNNVNFTIARGEIVGIIGVNGSGKSTVLKIITGVLAPTAGDVKVNGKVSALLELGAGFNPDYTGIENIFLSGTMMGYKKEEIEEKVPEIIRFADIGDYIHQPVKTYSSGMFARLAFAVAINVDPDILIIDEALSVGDYFFQSKCYKKFEEFKKRGKTILFVSHDMGSILKYCDKAILLNKGEMIDEGEVKRVIDRYKRLLSGVDVGKPEDDVRTDFSATREVSPLMQDQMNINPNFLEYGDKAMEIIDFGVRNASGEITNFVNKNEEFSVFMKVNINQDIESPVFAFTIKDLKGTELFGTNTHIEQAGPDRVKSGDRIEISFTQKMYLNGGNYLLSFGGTSYSHNELVVRHRLYDICSVDVISEKRTVGYVDFNTSVDVKVSEA